MIAVLAGDLVARWIPPQWIKRAAGALFVVLGVMFLIQARAGQTP
jgi:putative Ca2+/H+ antiporter (TMEM165/GDT1 family)